MGYDKDNGVLYNPTGLSLKSYAEVAVFKDTGSHEFLVKGGIAFRLYIVTAESDIPELFLNGMPIAYQAGGIPDQLITLEFPRSSMDAPRKDLVRIKWAPGGTSNQRVTMVYDKYEI